MKKNYIVASIAIFVILLSFLNPSKQEYVEWIGKDVDKLLGTDKKSGLEWAANKGVEMAGKAVLESNVSRENFLVFSVFRVKIMGMELQKHIGFSGRFF